MGTQPVGDVVDPGAEPSVPGNDVPNTPTGPAGLNDGVEMPSDSDAQLPGGVGVGTAL